MAETQLLSPENSEAEQNQAEESDREPKGPGGRPRGARNKPKEEPAFFDRLPGLDWNRHNVWLYRVEPKVDRGKTGDARYIQLFGEAFTPDTVMKDPTWGGSGVYKAILKYSPAKGAQEDVDTHYFPIENRAYPPCVPLAQWIDDPVNKKWAWAKEMLEAKEGKASQNGVTSQGQQDVGKQVKEVLQEIRQGQVSPTETFNSMMNAHQTGVKQGMEIAKQSAPPAGGGEVVELLKTLLPALLKTPAPVSEESPVVKVLTLQLESEREQRKADREQAKADREAADKRADAAEKRHTDLMTAMMQRKETSGLESVQQFAQIFSAVRGITDGGLVAPTDTSFSGVMMDGLRDALPDVLRSLAPGVGQMLSGIGTGAPRLSVSRETISPVLPPVNQPQAGNPGAAPAQQQAAPPPFDPQFAPAYNCIFMSQGAILNAMRTGKTGADFGDWLANGPGEMEIEKLKAAGVDNLVKFIAHGMPPLWAELQPVELKFRQFLGELMAWEPVDDDEEDLPAVNPTEIMPGPANAKRGGKKGPAGGKVQ